MVIDVVGAQIITTVRCVDGAAQAALEYRDDLKELQALHSDGIRFLPSQLRW